MVVGVVAKYLCRKSVEKGCWLQWLKRYQSNMLLFSNKKMLAAVVAKVAR